MRHVYVGGNAIFINGDDKNEIKNVVSKILDSPKMYKTMREVAEKKAIPYFSYKEISKRAIEIE